MKIALAQIDVKAGSPKINFETISRYIELAKQESVDMILFFWRLFLILLVWIFIWKKVQPKTLSLRTLRAALIAFSMIVILAIIKTIGV